jgi:large subunit ribosomal protein L3
MYKMLVKKSHMTQVWKGEAVVPVTVLKASANTVSQVKTKERDKYSALQLSLGKTKREFRTKNAEHSGKVGDKITVSMFKEGDEVAISGLTKGRGFQGVVKRHGFAGGPKTHGQKNRHRAPGSIGATAPQRVTPGRRMAGRMGQERVTIKNLKVVEVDVEKNILMIRGAVPGARGAVLEIRKT